MQSPTVICELWMIMPFGKLAFERNGYFGFRYINEGIGCTYKPLPTINFDEQQMVRCIALHTISTAGRVHVMHAHARDITQCGIESSSTGSFRCL